jgi:hypothetical protein
MLSNNIYPGTADCDILLNQKKCFHVSKTYVFNGNTYLSSLFN